VPLLSYKLLTESSISSRQNNYLMFEITEGYASTVYGGASEWKRI
jgi:hypothetical protein